MLWPLHGSAGLHLGHGSCFSFTPFSGYPYASIPRHLAGPVFLSGVSPRGSSTCPPTLSGFWDCHPSQVFQPHTFPGGAVSVGRLRFHLFQGFSVGGTHLSAAICNRRISVMRLDYREPVAVASRRSFFASSPSSGRLAFFLAGSPPSWWLPGTVVLQLCLHSSWNRPVLEAPILASMECLHGLQWWLHLPRLSACLCTKCLLSFTFGQTPRTWVGVPISTVRSLRAYRTPVRRRCLSTPGNC